MCIRDSGNGEYLIHGTSAPDSVGLRVSSGCIRMNAPDIKALFSSVRTGTPVKVINEPVKYSVEPNGMRYVEVHRPLSAEEQQNVQTMPYTLPAGFTQFKDNKGVDQKLVDKALYRRAGYPVSVSSGATPAASNAPSVESAQNGEPVSYTHLDVYKRQALTSGHQQADTGTKMIHIGKNTKSTIISKGISAGHSQNSYRGLVKIMPTATNARNFTQCDSMLIGANCGAHTFPYVECRNNSAQLEHEATTSRIGEDQLFYCLQRGISEEAVSYTHLEINPEEGWVRVEAGVIKDQLNQYLKPFGYFFAPELSTSNRATLGGMINTDASGQGSLVYGKTSDHVLDVYKRQPVVRRRGLYRRTHPDG